MISTLFRPTKTLLRLLVVFMLLGSAYLATATDAAAASLQLSPNTGVYTANNTFTARVLVNPGGQSINAAEGTLSFNPAELSVVSVSRAGSIFNLWVTEPTYSNTAGTISFSGGSPTGYSGQTGTIMTVTFRAVAAGTARVNFTNGSVLANDGKGTNILTAMNGGVYTIQAKSTAPEPEVIEYIAPANTPAAPVIRSTTHPDPGKWYSANEAVLSWSLPAGVVAVRTLLDESPTTVPTKVYEDPISSITLSDLPEGESYFHLQFKNDEGWGKVTHYRLAADTENPSKITIALAPEADLTDPEQTLMVKVVDDTSAVRMFKVTIDADEPYDFVDETGSSTIALPPLDPGYHTVFIEAFDEAGNSIVGTYSFTILSFDKPVFTEYPSEINEEVIPVIKGLTRPEATVTIKLARVGGEPSVYSVVADVGGEFIFIPEGTFSNGVYELTAQATDLHGAQSAVSEAIRIAVQQPGYLRVGSLIVSVLSVLVPLIVLIALLSLGLWYLVLYARRFRKQVRAESIEAYEIVQREFADLQISLRQQESLLRESRRTKKLTKAEAQMIEEIDRALQSSQAKVEKEIKDVTILTRHNSNS